MLDSKVDDSSRTSCVGFCLWLSPWCEMMRILGIFEDRGASPGQPSCNWLVCSSSCCRACSSELLYQQRPSFCSNMQLGYPRRFLTRANVCPIHCLPFFRQRCSCCWKDLASDLNPDISFSPLAGWETPPTSTVSIFQPRNSCCRRRRRLFNGLDKIVWW